MPFDESDRTATILVVDDEDDLRKLLIRLLKDEGFNVLQAGHAGAALVLLKQHGCEPLLSRTPIDLVLLDVALPDMDGVTLFTVMQKHEVLQHIPVIFLTGDSEYGQKAMAFEAGAVDYITKPFQAKDLMLRIRAHIRDKWQHDKEQQQAKGIADRAQLSLHEAEQRFSSLVRNSFHLVCELDQGLNIVYASPNHSEILSYEPLQLEAVYWPDFVHESDREDLIKSLRQILKSGSDKRVLLRFRDNTQRWRWLDACGSALKTSAGETHLLLVSRDITHAKETESYLQHLALHDSLTGLANRQRFTSELERVVAEHTDASCCAVMYIDVDNFKLVNDRHGHIIGDQVLKAVGEFLKEVLGEAHLISRFGGDEFCVLVRAGDHESASSVGERACDLIRRHPILCSGTRHRITLSTGIALVEDSLNFEEVLSRANTALHVAKSRGKNRSFIYRSDSTELLHIRSSAEWFQRIQEGLEEYSFEAWYQPLMDLRTGGIAHYEALIRFRGEEGDIHGPAEFLSSAERYSLMPQLDRYMIRKVFSDLVSRPDLKVTVNLSGSSVTDPRIADYVIGCFNETGVNPDNVVFEITETVFMTNLVQARAIVEKLQELGCRFALDDFGSGFSSLNYLRHLPVDFVKIDGSFIKEIHSDPVNLTLVKSINEIAHLLGKETVAEWIESAETLEILQEIGFDYGQGYHIGKPKKIEEFANLGLPGLPSPQASAGVSRFRKTSVHEPVKAASGRSKRNP